MHSVWACLLYTSRALLAIEDGDKQYNVAMRIFDEKLSVREIEKPVSYTHLLASDSGADMHKYNTLI